MRRQCHIKNLFHSGVFPVLLCLTATAYAAPTGEDLLNACTMSIENGFDNAAGPMCTWYITPCNCDESLPPVCLPDSISTVRLAREVVSGIEAKPELKSEPAALAAADVLSGIYACNGEQY